MNAPRLNKKPECTEIWRSNTLPYKYQEVRYGFDNEIKSEAKISTPLTQKPVCTSFNAVPLANTDGYGQLGMRNKFPVPVQEYYVKHVPVETSTTFYKPQALTVTSRPNFVPFFVENAPPAPRPYPEKDLPTRSVNETTTNRNNSEELPTIQKATKRTQQTRPKVSASKPLGWKRAYIQPVKDARNKERIGVIVLGPRGPEVYSKTQLQATPSPAKVDSSRSTDKEWKSDNNDQLLSPPSGKGVHSKSDNYSNNGKHGSEVKKSNELGSGDSSQPTNKEKSTEEEKDPSTEKKIICEKGDGMTAVGPSTAPKSPDATKMNSSIYSATFQQDHYEQHGSEFDNNKTATSSQISSSSKRTPSLTRRRKSSNGNHLKKDREEHINGRLRKKADENQFITSEERMKLLKEALPSVAAASEADHLQQLQTCISKFLDEMARRSDEQLSADGDSDASCVRFRAQKLIDAVSYPIRKLSSNIAVNATQSITDALLASDEESTDQMYLEKLKKIRSKHIGNIISEVKNLEEIVRIMDKLQSTPRYKNKNSKVKY